MPPAPSRAALPAPWPPCAERSEGEGEKVEGGGRAEQWAAVLTGGREAGVQWKVIQHQTGRCRGQSECQTELHFILHNLACLPYSCVPSLISATTHPPPHEWLTTKPQNALAHQPRHVTQPIASLHKSPPDPPLRSWPHGPKPPAGCVPPPREPRQCCWRLPPWCAAPRSDTTEGKRGMHEGHWADVRGRILHHLACG